MDMLILILLGTAVAVWISPELKSAKARGIRRHNARS